MSVKSMWATVLVMGLVSAPQQAAGGKSAGSFSLAKAVPGNCWLYVHGTANPERDFLDKHWNQVFEAFKKVQIDRDIRAMVNNQLSTEEERAEFNKHWDKAMALFKSIQWGDLAAHEFVFCQRFSPLPESSVLLKPEKATLQENLKGLVSMLEELASLDETMALSTSERAGAKIWTLTFGPGAPVSLNLFHHTDGIGMSSSPLMTGDIIDMLAGSSTQPPLVAGERYRRAFGDLPKPEDSISFLDLTTLWSNVRGLMDQEAGAGDDEEMRIVKKVLDELDFIDYIAITEQTNGLKTVQHAVTRVSEQGKTKKLCRVFADRKPMTGFLKHVPQEASGYSAWSGADLDGLYQFVQNFLTSNFAKGPQWMAQWQQWQQANAFNLQQDVLDWLDGQFISVAFAAPAPAAMAPGEGVMLVKVRDKDKAMGALEKQLSRLGETVTLGQAAGVNADGFRTLAHPMMMMMGVGQLVYGVHDNWLYVSNTSSAINKCLASAKGEAPSFEKNERFVHEGVHPKGPVAAASFTDTSGLGQQYAMMLSMMPMGAAMMPPSPDSEVARSALMMVGKLAPVAGEIDFMRSTSGTCVFQGDHWRSETVTTHTEFKPPAEGSQPTEEKPRGVEGL